MTKKPIYAFKKIGIIDISQLRPDKQIERIKKRLIRNKITSLQEATDLIKEYKVCQKTNILWRNTFCVGINMPSQAVENFLKSIYQDYQNESTN